MEENEVNISYNFIKFPDNQVSVTSDIDENPDYLTNLERSMIIVKHIEDLFTQLFKDIEIIDEDNLDDESEETKKGLNKVINYRKSLDFLEFKDGVVSFVLKCGQDPIIPSFRADEFLKTVYGDDSKFDVKRVCFFDKNLRVI